MRIFDSHCHIDVAEFDNDRAEVLDQAEAAGVRDLLVPAIQRSGWRSLTALCANDARLHLALGLHPVFVAQHSLKDIPALVEAVEIHNPVAIGEIGLDWQIKTLDRRVQQKLLEDQLEIAEATQLPLVLHVRKAHDQMLQTLKRFRLCGGFCHAFNGSLPQASHYLDLNFRLGFGGMVTFERSRHLRNLATTLPQTGIVLETDAPDMTVASHQYQRNSPAFLPEVLLTLGQLRDIDPAALAEQTRQNTLDVLNLG